jgi:hypothetical protein
MNWGWGGIHKALCTVHMPRMPIKTHGRWFGRVRCGQWQPDIRTGDGHIRAEGAKGDIRLRTGDGSIEGHDLTANSRHYGDGHGILTAVLTRSTSRPATEALPPALTRIKLENANVHTGDGSVTMSVPGDLQANIDATTNDGRISLGIPVTVEGNMGTSQIHGKMNGGGQPLTIHTGDGSIHLSKT